MALEEMKMGGDDPDARRELETARTKFTAMLAETQQTLEALWTRWDAAVDTNNQRRERLRRSRPWSLSSTAAATSAT